MEVEGDTKSGSDGSILFLGIFDLFNQFEWFFAPYWHWAYHLETLLLRQTLAWQTTQGSQGLVTARLPLSSINIWTNASSTSSFPIQEHCPDPMFFLLLAAKLVSVFFVNLILSEYEGDF